MNDYNEEIHALKRKVREQMGSLQLKLDENLAKQQVEHLQKALKALDEDDFTEALNHLLQANLVEEIRKQV